MSLEEKYFLENGVCNLTFKIPAYLDEKAGSAKAVSELDNWSPSGNSILKNEYQLRYLEDETSWETDSLSPGTMKSIH